MSSEYSVNYSYFIDKGDCLDLPYYDGGHRVYINETNNIIHVREAIQIMISSDIFREFQRRNTPIVVINKTSFSNKRIVNSLKRWGVSCEIEISS